jgi:transcriptional regulator with XRE-family HTH domain
MAEKQQKRISSALRRLRQERRWSQSEFAQKLGISQSRLSEIESGKGSISAEQLITVMQTFNVPLNYFVKTKATDPEAPLRNAIARLGGSQLTEDPNILPSEKLNDIYTVIFETLVGGASSRLITSLVPVIINNAPHVNFSYIQKKLAKYRLENRLYWIGEGIIRALDQRLTTFVPREQSLKYRRAKTILDNFFGIELRINKGRDFHEDLLDSDIASQKTLDQIKVSRDDLANKWHIVTRITEDDFYQSLLAAEQNA